MPVLLAIFYIVTIDFMLLGMLRTMLR